MELHWKILKRIQKLHKIKFYEDLQKFDVNIYRGAEIKWQKK